MTATFVTVPSLDGSLPWQLGQSKIKDWFATWEASWLDGEAVENHLQETAMKMYCIEHDHMVEGRPMEFCDYGHDHFVTALYGDVVVRENDFCCFDSGYAFVPPPEEFYIVGHADLPSPEELEEINSVASELLTDWK